MPRAARPTCWPHGRRISSPRPQQPVVVENKAGAQGAIGAEAAARSEPDGYTLFFTAASIFVLNPMLYKKLPYDPVKGFRMLALVTDLPVRHGGPSFRARQDVAEFVAYATKPGKHNFGSADRGRDPSGRRDVQADGRRRHGPCRLQGRGAGADRSDIGQYPVDVRYARHRVSADQGRIAAPAGGSSAKRVPDLPDVPTMAESGYPEYGVSVWYGVSAKAKLPDEVAKKVTASLNKALSDDAFRASLEKVGFPAVARSRRD